MGIKGINKVLKERYDGKYEKHFMTTDISILKDKTVVIDSNNVIYPFYTSAHNVCVSNVTGANLDIDEERLKKLFLGNLLEFLSLMKINNIKTIWVWDGETRVEKKETVDDRISKMKETRDKIKAMRNELSEIDELERICLDGKILDEYKKLLKADIGIKWGYGDLARETLKKLGYPVVQSKHDGEKTCVDIQLSELADVVWTTDTDVYAIGATFVCRGFAGFVRDGDKVINAINFVNLTEIREEINLRDLCILLGNDFNTNIPRCGPVGCIKLLNEFGSIENIKGKDISCLNYEKCVEFFEPELYEDEIEEFNPDLFDLNIHDVLSTCEVSEYTKKRFGIVTIPSFE